jgi:carboxymethylenebutenolidase
MGDTDPEDVARDLYAVIDRARSLPECNGHVVTLGVSFGGRFAVEAAADGIVDAAVTWHGAGLVPLAERLGGGAAPLSLHFGEEDPTNPLTDVERLRLALASHPSAEVRVYPGARPGFALPHHAAWDATAAAGAMSGLRRSLQLLLGPRRPRRLIWI